MYFVILPLFNNDGEMCIFIACQSRRLMGHNIFLLIAEIMDFGYPQNLSPEILKLYITQEGVRSPFSSKVRSYCILLFTFSSEKYHI